MILYVFYFFRLYLFFVYLLRVFLCFRNDVDDRYNKRYKILFMVFSIQWLVYMLVVGLDWVGIRENSIL